jgi:hypothetical protein
MYAISLAAQALRGRWRLYLAGFGRVPWGDPLVPLLLGSAATALLLAMAVVPRLGRMPNAPAALGVLKVRNLLRAALLAAVAVCGLVLGTRIGPSTASLSLAMFVVAALGGWAVFPSEAQWREVMNIAARMGTRLMDVR